MMSIYTILVLIFGMIWFSWRIFYLLFEWVVSLVLTRSSELPLQIEKQICCLDFRKTGPREWEYGSTATAQDARAGKK